MKHIINGINFSNFYHGIHIVLSGGLSGLEIVSWVLSIVIMSISPAICEVLSRNSLVLKRSEVYYGARTHASSPVTWVKSLLSCDIINYKKEQLSVYM